MRTHKVNSQLLPPYDERRGYIAFLVETYLDRLQAVVPGGRHLFLKVCFRTRKVVTPLYTVKHRPFSKRPSLMRCCCVHRQTTAEVQLFSRPIFFIFLGLGLGLGLG